MPNGKKSPHAARPRNSAPDTQTPTHPQPTPSHYCIAYFHNAVNSGVLTAVYGAPTSVAIEMPRSPLHPRFEHRWRLERAETTTGVSPWWRIRSSEPARNMFLTIACAPTDCYIAATRFDCYALTIEAPLTNGDAERQHWYFEAYPQTFDQTAPMFGNSVRIWSRFRQAAITFDYPYQEASPIFARSNRNEGGESHWFACMVPWDGQ